MATIHIPSMMRQLTGGQAEIRLAGRTVKELLDALEARHPGIRDRLMDSQGALYRHVKLFLNDEDIGYGDWGRVTTDDRDRLIIVTAMAGG